MRKIRLIQLPLPSADSDDEHVHMRELREMSKLLDEIPDAAALVHANLVKPKVSATKGRNGMTAEQVLRALLIKQMNGFSYKELAYHLADSMHYRTFCHIGPGQKSPKKSALQENIKLIKAETLETINRMLLEAAEKRGFENGKKVRTDCTVVETNIHEPSDSSLLWDGVRVLVRLMQDAKELGAAILFTDHSRRGKRRSLNIQYAKTKEQRVALYGDLLKVTEKTVHYAERAIEQIKNTNAADLMTAIKLDGIAHELRRFVGLTNSVISQTERRVLRGESVPASEKVVSIFEPHTDIIIKDNRKTLYGHKVCFTAGASGLILDIVVQEGNPADSNLPVDMMKRQNEIYGAAPRQAAFDGGFASRTNLEEIKKLGVKDVAFSKGRGLGISDMVKSTWVYRKLRNFRAGVESSASFLKRVFGWDRCNWSGFSSFKAYAWASVLACNALLFARHALK
jgi:IS5 family transposase